jgi:Ca2+-binding EF-hand superfamily protein
MADPAPRPWRSSVLLPAVDQDIEQRWHAAFERFDRDANHQLDRKEFRKFMQEVAPADRKKYIFDVVDSQHTGWISLEAFLRFARAMADISDGRNDSRRFFSLVFESCDEGGKGSLTRWEFCKFMRRIGRPIPFFQQKKKFRDCDIDGNGAIDLDEILEYLDESERGIRRKARRTQ